MENVELKAALREDVGKGGCGQLRKKGYIPAVVYKQGKKGINIQIDSKVLWGALHTEAGVNAIISLDISGSGQPEKEAKRGRAKKNVIVTEVQLDPVDDSFLHVDFHEISLKEKLKVKVPVTVKGEAVGVVEDSGVLTQTVWELEVECLPTEIPEHIEVHVEELRIGDAVHVKEIDLPKDVEVVGDPEQVILSVSPPHVEEEVEEEVPVEEMTDPEVIKKGKKEEEEGEAPPEGE
ncbi:MAG: 50S ribosomal protein L25 [Candidatus Makaraimicrobium thalassicum]|nr:MAG: 50S ribosomal protein L25 [Candidatus Omnitrophota bacterium]